VTEEKAALEAERDAANEGKDAAEAALATAQEEIAGKDEKIAELEGERDAANEVKEAAEAALATSQEESAGKDEKIAELEGERDSEKEAKDAAEAALATITEKDYKISKEGENWIKTFTKDTEWGDTPITGFSPETPVIVVKMKFYRKHPHLLPASCTYRDMVWMDHIALNDDKTIGSQIPSDTTLYQIDREDWDRRAFIK